MVQPPSFLCLTSFHRRFSSHKTDLFISMQIIESLNFLFYYQVIKIVMRQPRSCRVSSEPYPLQGTIPPPPCDPRNCKADFREVGPGLKLGRSSRPAKSSSNWSADQTPRTTAAATTTYIDAILQMQKTYAKKYAFVCTKWAANGKLVLSQAILGPLYGAKKKTHELAYFGCPWFQLLLKS